MSAEPLVRRVPSTRSTNGPERGGLCRIGPVARRPDARVRQVGSVGSPLVSTSRPWIPSPSTYRRSESPGACRPRAGWRCRRPAGRRSHARSFPGSQSRDGAHGRRRRRGRRCGSCRSGRRSPLGLVDDVRHEGGVLDQTALGVGDVPGVDPGALLAVGVELEVGPRGAGQALQVDSVDVAVDRQHRDAGSSGGLDAEACPRERAGDGIEEDPPPPGFVIEPPVTRQPPAPCTKTDGRFVWPPVNRTPGPSATSTPGAGTTRSNPLNSPEMRTVPPTTIRSPGRACSTASAKLRADVTRRSPRPLGRGSRVAGRGVGSSAWRACAIGAA